MNFAKRIIGSVLLGIYISANIVLPVFAADDPDPSGARYEVDSVTKCGTPDPKNPGVFPSNCIFLEEPIGGTKEDLFLRRVVNKKLQYSSYSPGGAIPVGATVVQAILTKTPGKEYQGPFGLLYGYLGLIYTYISGVIVGVAVLFVVIGGIQITTSSGNDTAITAGKDRIKKAIIGLIVWFLASLILYTINPTFFVFAT